MVDKQKRLQAWVFPGPPATPNDTQLNWPALQERFSWLRAMDGVPQNPVYHAEGDVLIHTRMVTEAMLALGEWREHPLVDRQVLFAAAMLHDVGKPAGTASETGGGVGSRGHAGKGEKKTPPPLLLGGELLPPPPLV